MDLIIQSAKSEIELFKSTSWQVLWIADLCYIYGPVRLNGFQKIARALKNEGYIKDVDAFMTFLGVMMAGYCFFISLHSFFIRKEIFFIIIYWSSP